jgi:hypothetical protein
MNSRRLLGVMLAAATIGSSSAYANVVYTFAANGVTESYAQQGTATFSFANDGSSLSITLTDTVDPTAAILSEISGIQFSLSAPASMTLTSVVATDVVDCSDSASPCPPGDGSSPYGWGTLSTGGTTMLAAGFDGVSFAWQPYGIVNQNYISIVGDGGLSTPSNNPLLIGPVTFNFSLSGLSYAPEVTNVVFLFGDPVPVLGPLAVPEPGTVALLAVGLLGIAWGLRRRERRSDA